uniref:Uncharacterized protein n=1 Tax=Oryza rufipogon TaxID=4529 RepID=A0A0E0RB62_ORYRU
MGVLTGKIFPHRVSWVRGRSQAPRTRIPTGALYSTSYIPTTSWPIENKSPAAIGPSLVHIYTRQNPRSQAHGEESSPLRSHPHPCPTSPPKVQAEWPTRRHQIDGRRLHETTTRDPGRSRRRMLPGVKGTRTRGCPVPAVGTGTGENLHPSAGMGRVTGDSLQCGCGTGW